MFSQGLLHPKRPWPDGERHLTFHPLVHVPSSILLGLLLAHTCLEVEPGCCPIVFQTNGPIVLQPIHAGVVVHVTVFSSVGMTCV